jgi:hypothetical protein
MRARQGTGRVAKKRCDEIFAARKCCREAVVDVFTARGR